MARSTDGEPGPSRRSRPPGLKRPPRLRQARKGSGRKPPTNRSMNLLERAIVCCLSGQQSVHAFAIVKALRHPDGQPMFVESSIYRALARLTEDKFLEKDDGARPNYAATLKGLEAMKAWLTTPAGLPIQVSSEAWLRIASTRFYLYSDVLRGLAPLREELDQRADDLELMSRKLRYEGTWDIANELEYRLEREVLEASRRWLIAAIELLEAKAAWGE